MISSRRAFTSLSLVLVFLYVASATIDEKIFVHERGQNGTDGLKKLGRIELDHSNMDQLRRAIEGIKDNVPTYTGYFFLDLLFEMFKTVFVFLMTLMTPPELVTSPEDVNVK